MNYPTVLLKRKEKEKSYTFIKWYLIVDMTDNYQKVYIK